MTGRWMASLAAMAALTLAAVGPANAEQKWIKPAVKECTLKAGQECNIDKKCPAELPFIVNGGGGMPKVSSQDHSVAMTMNLAISKDTWRIRYKNLAGGPEVKVKMAARIKCADNAKEAGW